MFTDRTQRYQDPAIQFVRLGQSAGSSRPGCRVAHSPKHRRWIRNIQRLQDLFLNRVQFGKLLCHDRAGRVADNDQTILGKGLQNPRDAGPQSVPPFRLV